MGKLIDRDLKNKWLLLFKKLISSIWVVDYTLEKADTFLFVVI